MSSTTKLLIAFMCVLIIVFIVFCVLIYSTSKRARKKEQVKAIGTRKRSAKERRNTFLFVMYRIFTTFPLTKKYFHKIVRKTHSLYPSDMISVNQKATRLMLNAVFVMFACIILGVLVSGADLYYILATILTSYLIFTMMIYSGFAKMESKLLNQFITFLSNVRHNYHETKIVDDAIYDTLEDAPFEISLHITKIHEIITSPYMEEKVSEYISSAPNRYFLTFVSICTSIKDYGDKDLDNGSSLFLTNLNYLKEEINMELLKMQMIKNAFSLLEIIAIVPVMTLKLIEMWAVGNIEELATTYEGRYGIIAMTVIFAITMLCYKIISTCRNTDREEIKEKTIWVKISNLPFISPFLNRIVNKNYGKTLKINDKLKMTGDHTGTKAFLLKRFVYAIAIFVFTTGLFFAGNISERIKVLGDYSDSFEEAIIPNDAYFDAMLECADQFSNYYKGEDLTEEDKAEIIDRVVHETSITNTAYAEMVTDVVIEKVSTYNSVYYKWYYLIISLVLSLITFYAPLMFLNFRIMILNMMREDEINQFNTLMLILMYVDGVTIDLILEWLERFSYCFKPTIQKCIINLEHGERQALEQMKQEETFLPFKQFVDNLISVDDIGVQSAFDEIKTDRDYYKDKRKQDNITQVKKRAFYAKICSYIPLFTVIAVYIIIPMVLMALKMFSTMNLSFGAY